MEKPLTEIQIDPKTGKIYDANIASVMQIQNILWRTFYPKTKEARDLIYEMLLDCDYKALGA